MTTLIWGYLMRFGQAQKSQTCEPFNVGEGTPEVEVGTDELEDSI